MTLRLPAAVRDAIVAHARTGVPEEVVGVLAGHHGEDCSTVERAYRARNAAERPRTRYEIAPTQELSLLDSIDTAGLDVVGFYHSHPDGPDEPSRTDAELAAWPGCSYLIVSLAGEEPVVGCWRWTGETFRWEDTQVL